MPGSSGTVTVTGTNSMLIYDYVHVGIDGSAALNIKAGGLVSSEFCYLGNISSATSTTTVSGVGSTLSVSERIEIKGLALEPAGDTLNVKSGGQINSKHGWVINSTIRVTDAGSKWSISDELWFISSTLNIEAGGEVNNLDGKINESAGSTVTVTGAGSKWINRGTLYVGEQSSSNPGNSTLNIGSGIASDGMVMAKEFVLRLGTCNLNGGTLQTGIIRTETAATFNWSDGTIRNLDANTNLGVGGVFSLKLASTGTHAFYIDAGRIGSIGAILCDSTSGGTLEKQGGGSLTLSGANTYTGSTTIAAGKLTLSSTGSLASSPIDVKSGATFDVSAKKGYVLAAGKTLTGSGTIVGDLSVGGIHAPGNSTGVETVKGNYSLLGELQIELAGTTAGTGYDEVLISGSSAYNAALSGTLSLDWTSFNGSTDATQLWIVKNDTAGTLSGAFSNYANGASLGLHDGRSWNLYYNADAATGNLTGGNDVLIAPVPEPATIILLALSALAALVWSRKSRVGQA
jgi:autotransporter-associated beta strand protein/T5SS/PEP-CTERM-associated repeat protein